MHPINRRDFLSRASLAGAALLSTGALSSLHAADTPPETINLAVMGLSRGASLATDFAKLPGVRITHICEVDDLRLRQFQSSFAKVQSTQPTAVKDFRRILDDPSVHALVIAAPDHWHAPATILACAAGKHVYCEKPASHNLREGELM
ncbi:MAG: Gfo/Idh/MocA family protein, partial [Bacillota bacterium]